MTEAGNQESIELELEVYGDPVPFETVGEPPSPLPTVPAPAPRPPLIPGMAPAFAQQAAGAGTPPELALRPAGGVAVPAPFNRFLVMTEGGKVRIRGLPIGRLTSTEARALAAWILLAADEVQRADDQEFQDLYAAVLRAHKLPSKE